MDQTVHRITMHHAMDRRLAVRCEGLCKHYPHFELQDVDLAFEWGTVMGRVGPCLVRKRFCWAASCLLQLGSIVMQLWGA